MYTYAIHESFHYFTLIYIIDVDVVGFWIALEF